MYEPTLRIKVNCDTESDYAKLLVSQLQLSAKSASFVKGGVIINPAINAQNEYILPEEIDEEKYTLLIDITECGGWNGLDDKNTAQIVCGISGKALKPYFIPRLNVVECGNHAFFSVPEGCVAIQAQNENVIIKEIKVDFHPEYHYATLVEKEYYSGHVDDLPLDLIRFKMAAQIAVDKSNCEKCTHVHYYLDANQIITKSKKRV